jgi:hypothetical protein
MCFTLGIAEEVFQRCVSLLELLKRFSAMCLTLGIAEGVSQRSVSLLEVL